MRSLAPAVALALLAACGGGADPAANRAEAGAPLSNAVVVDERAGLAAWREDVLRGCIGGGRERAGPGVPVEAQCTCAVDREMAGKTLAELETTERSGAHGPAFAALLRQCIVELPG